MRRHENIIYFKSYVDLEINIKKWEKFSLKECGPLKY